MTIQSYTFTGPEAGKHLLIFGAIHGDEVCGTKALLRLKGELESGAVKLQAGRLTMVPVCNQRAYEANKRFIDKNLNRIFTDTLKTDPVIYESMLAPELMGYLKNCDTFLDLHSYGDDDPIALLDFDTPVNREMVEATGIRDILVGWPELYADKLDLSAGDTVQYAVEHGKDAIIVECGKHGAPAADEVAYQTALRIMAYTGLVAPVSLPTVQKRICRMKHIVVKEVDGKFTKPWRQLDAFKKGDEIARYADGRIVTAPFDGNIIFPNPIAAIGHEWVYLGVLE